MQSLYEDLLYDVLPKKVQFYIQYTAANPMMEKFLVAIRHDSVSLVKYFLEAGINVNDALLVESPLSAAVRCGHPVMVHILLAAGADHNVKSIVFNATLFHDIFSDYGRWWAGPASEDRTSRLNNLVIIAALLREKGLHDAKDWLNRTANDVLAWSLKVHHSSLSDEASTGFTTELLEKINNADLSVIRAVNIVAEPPEVVLAMTPQEQQQMQDYKNEQMGRVHNRILRSPVIHAADPGNRIEIRPALFGHSSQIVVADEKAGIADMDIAALVAAIDISESLERQPETINHPSLERSTSSDQSYGMRWRRVRSFGSEHKIEKARIGETREALNGTQKNIIQGYLHFIFETLREELTTPQFIRALQAMLAKRVSVDERRFFQSLELWDGHVGQMRAVFSHQAPQKLLNLSSRNDDTASSVTKSAVVHYITQLIQEQMQNALQKNAATTTSRETKQADALHDGLSDYLDDTSSLVEVSKRCYGFFQPKRMASALLSYVINGNQDKAAQLPKLSALLDKADVTDRAGRKFKQITAYQYALWALDGHMVRMIEDKARHATGPEGECIRAALLAQRQQLIAYDFNGKHYCERHYNPQPLFDAYQVLIDNYETWFKKHAHYEVEDAYSAIAFQQLLMPVHSIQELCTPQRSFYPTPTFKEMTLHRMFDQGLLLSDLKPVEGRMVAICRGGLAAWSIADPLITAGVCWAYDDLNALQTLFSVRAAEIRPIPDLTQKSEPALVGSNRM